MERYFEWLLRKSASNSLAPAVFEKSSIVCSCLHHPTFDQQKWLYCWCRFLSYRLIVFNKESIGTNYMVLRLVIDKALRLMMWEKLGLCLCAWKVSDGGLWYLKCIKKRMWVCPFSPVFFKWFGFSKSIHHDGQLEVKKGSFNLMHGYPSKLSQGLAAYHLFC